jgi:caffeoyl-CoA O-methyltransferase
VLLVDNVLWSGRVVDEGVADEDTVALRMFNDVVAADGRVEAVVLTAFDGLTIARKL